MKRLLLATLLLATASNTPALADDCQFAEGLGPGLATLLDGFHHADETGQASLSTQAFLAGVTEISEPNRQALNRRSVVRVVRRSLATGSVESEGPVALEFKGMFAGKERYFRVPSRIRARYEIGPNSATLTYQEGDAIQLGEAIPFTDIPIFRTIDHVVIAKDLLLFFWTGNTGPTADRCYRPHEG